MKKTAADQIVEMMIDVGIQRVYGVVGDSINPIVDAIRRSDGKLRWVHCRNEEVGAFAAGAEALLTGQITACAGSCGPGNLHLIQGLYNSHRNRAPVFAMTASSSSFSPVFASQMRMMLADSTNCVRYGRTTRSKVRIVAGQVLVPHLEVGLGDAGVRGKEEQHGVRVGQLA